MTCTEITQKSEIKSQITQWSNYSYKETKWFAKQSANNLRYASDKVLVAECLEDLLINSVMEVSENNGLTLNVGKTKFMITTTRQQGGESLRVRTGQVRRKVLSSLNHTIWLLRWYVFSTLFYGLYRNPPKIKKRHLKIWATEGSWGLVGVMVLQLSLIHI